MTVWLRTVTVWAAFPIQYGISPQRKYCICSSLVTTGYGRCENAQTWYAGPEFSDQIGFTVETPGQFFGPGGKGDMITHDTLGFSCYGPAGPTAKKSREHNCGHSLRFSHCKSYFVAFVKLPSLSKSRTVLSESATL